MAQLVPAESSFAKPAPQARGEMRVRETTSEEKQDASHRAAMLKLLRENPGKTQDEIAEMMR